MIVAASHALVILLVLAFAAGAHAQTAPTVLFTSSERLTALALHNPNFPGFARLGFGRADAPWHPWFGTSSMHALVHLPGHEPGAVVEGHPAMFVGSGFMGHSWESAFAALSSFDRDGNGIVEGDEMDDLYLWVDPKGDGRLATRVDSLYPAGKAYAGFDLRVEPRVVEGSARRGRLAAFCGLRRRDWRSHLLELEIHGAYPSRDQAILSHASLPQDVPLNAESEFSGLWRWTPGNIEAWRDGTRPWGDEDGGTLLLAVTGSRIHGVVRYVGAHGDHINLPLEGDLRAGGAEWTSVSPLGLTRSTVRLERVFGRPVLRGQAFSNRNGMLEEWTWSATYERPIE